MSSSTPGWSINLPEAVRETFADKCVYCHDGYTQEGDFDLEALLAGDADPGTAATWDTVLRRVRGGEMPPPDEEPLTAEERDAIAAAVDDHLGELAARIERRPTPQVRRLTKAQYGVTLSELLGLPIDFVADLPSDSKSKLGFTGAISSQQMSPLRIEYYEAIARRALGAAIARGPAPERMRLRITVGEGVGEGHASVMFPGYQTQPIDSDHVRVELIDGESGLLPTMQRNVGLCMRGSKRNRFAVTPDGLRLDSARPHVEKSPNSWRAPSPNAKMLVRRHFPATGPVAIRVVARPVGDGDKPPRLRAFVGSRTDDGIEYRTVGESLVVEGDSDEWRTYAFRDYLENLPIPVVDPNDREELSNILVVGVWNDELAVSDKQHAPALVLRSIEFDAPAYETWPPASHTAIFFDSSRREADPEGYSLDVIRRFAERAFRRPITDREADRYAAVFRGLRDEPGSLEDKVREVLVAVLCSPHFVYLDLPSEADSHQHTIASRLAYFLWNGPPDAELLELAQLGELTNRLGGQINRMLADERSWRFVETFTHEWLRGDRHASMATSPRRFPEYNRFVKASMARQVAAFFREVLTTDGTIDDLIDPGYALLDERLAEFYGAPEVDGAEFRRVGPTDSLPSAGLLTMGAMLNGHSDGVHPHPIKRAVWLRERLLGDPPPEPPPNVPELPKEGPGIEGLTLKERLELHRDNDSCRDCHRAIDPFGVVFERYDAVGRWIEDPSIDDSSVLPDGTRLDGVGDTQRYVLGPRRDDFVRSLATNLFAYATGVDVGFEHRSEIDRLVVAVDRDPRLASLVRAVVESDTFQRSSADN